MAELLPPRRILDEILKNKRRQIESAIPRRSKFEDFFREVRWPIVIPQIASKSITGNILFEGDLLDLLDAYEQGGAKVICVANTEYLGGNNQLFLGVRRLTDALLMGKSFITHLEEVLEMHEVGADALLYIVAAFEKEGVDLKLMIQLAEALDIAPVVEVYDERELDIALKADARIIAVNSRNINTGEESFEGALNLLAKIENDRIAFLFSSVRTNRDVISAYQAGAKGVLVCTAIVTDPNPVEKFRELSVQRI